jgi:hypothetical protein
VLSGATLWLSGAAPADIAEIALGVVLRRSQLPSWEFSAPA